MTKGLRKFTVSMGLMAITFGPVMVALMPTQAHADGFNFNVNVGDDDEAHFHFNDPHINRELWKAADNLRQAKHDLWKTRRNYGGHKGEAIRRINAALDELHAAADFERDHR